MTAKSTIFRRMACWIARRAASLLSERRSTWAEAMLREVDSIESDPAALAWAAGCAIAAVVEKARAMALLQGRFVAWALALMALWQAVVMAFAPAMTAAYRLHQPGLASILGGATPGDDFHRFIPLMQATPLWLLSLWSASAVFYLMAAWRLLRNEIGAFELVACALSLQAAGAALEQVLPGYAQLHRAAFTFAQPNLRRDVLLPGARLAFVAGFVGLLWLRDNRPPAGPEAAA